MLIDAYNSVMASERLAFVRVKFFGDPSTMTQLGSNPRVIWVPTKDTFGPPDTLYSRDEIIDGKRVKTTSRWLRHAGCQVFLFVDYDGVETGIREMESLINEFQMALYETLGSPGPNYQIGTAEWVLRDGIFDKSIQVVQPLTVQVPIWETQPAQLLGVVDVMGSRRSEPLPDT